MWWRRPWRKCRLRVDRRLWGTSQRLGMCSRPAGWSRQLRLGAWTCLILLIQKYSKNVETRRSNTSTSSGELWGRLRLSTFLRLRRRTWRWCRWTCWSTRWMSNWSHWSTCLNGSRCRIQGCLFYEIEGNRKILLWWTCRYCRLTTFDVRRKWSHRSPLSSFSSDNQSFLQETWQKIRARGPVRTLNSLEKNAASCRDGVLDQSLVWFCAYSIRIQNSLSSSTSSHNVFHLWSWKENVTMVTSARYVWNCGVTWTAWFGDVAFS